MSQQNARTRKSLAIAERRQEAAWYYLQGCTQEEIGRFLRVSKATINGDLKTLRAIWLKSALRDFDAARAQELAKIDHLERRYWKAWKQSCRDEVSVTTETVPSLYFDDDETLKTSTKRRGQSGNPAFLSGVLQCVAKRCELLGLDAPKRTELDIPAMHTPRPGRRPEDYSDEHLLQFLPPLLPAPDADAADDRDDEGGGGGGAAQTTAGAAEPD